VPINFEKIRELREKLGLTQLEAAKRAGFKTKQEWYRIESGENGDLRVSTLESVAAALGVKAKDLLK